MHRTVSSDDRIAMGNAMNLSSDQLRQVVALETGQAVVYGGGKFSDDNPILIRVPYAKMEAQTKPLTNVVRRDWESFIQRYDLQPIFQSYSTCDEHCHPLNPGCRQVKQWCFEAPLRGDIQRSLLSIVAERISLPAERDWNEVDTSFQTLTQRIKAVAPIEQMAQDDFRCAITHLVYDFLRLRAARRGRPFKVITELAQLLLPFMSVLDENSVTEEDFYKSAASFSEHSLRVNGPFYGCDAVCPTVNGKRLCLFFMRQLPVTFIRRCFKIPMKQLVMSKRTYPTWAGTMRNSHPDRSIQKPI